MSGVTTSPLDTGARVGTTLGGVLGWFAPPLQGASLRNRVVLALRTWWRNVVARPDVEVLLRGSSHQALAELVLPIDHRYLDGAAAYTRRWPRVRLDSADPLVRITQEERP